MIIQFVSGDLNDVLIVQRTVQLILQLGNPLFIIVDLFLQLLVLDLKFAKLLLKLDEIPKPDDAADAIACAVTHCQAGVAKAQFLMK